MASPSLFPKPPIKGSQCLGKIFFIFLIMLALIFPVFLKIYFLIAGKNYSGYIIKGPSTFVCLFM